MTVAICDGKGAMQLQERARPVPAPGDVVIRLGVSGICGSDLQLNADKTEPDAVPFGHEVAGEIAEVGEGVDPARVGQRVAVETLGHGLACTTCWYCRIGQYKQCMNKASDEGGGFAQYMKRRAIGCYPLPDTLSWSEGALIEPLAVSVHGVRRGRMIGGETVAVLGAGNIGLTAVAAARALGAGKVLVTARHEHQAEMARRLGADDVFSPDDSALWQALEKATGGRGADMTVDTVGGKAGDSVRQSIGVTRAQGRIVVLGGYRAPVTLDWLQPLLKEQTIVFSSCYGTIDGYHDYELAIDLLASGRVQLKQMVTHSFPFEDVQKAFDTAYDKGTGSIKVQLQMS